MTLLKTPTFQFKNKNAALCPRLPSKITSKNNNHKEKGKTFIGLLGTQNGDFARLNRKDARFLGTIQFAAQQNLLMQHKRWTSSRLKKNSPGGASYCFYIKTLSGLSIRRLYRLKLFALEKQLDSSWNRSSSPHIDFRIISSTFASRAFSSTSSLVLVPMWFLIFSFCRWGTTWTPVTQTLQDFPGLLCIWS